MPSANDHRAIKFSLLTVAVLVFAVVTIVFGAINSAAHSQTAVAPTQIFTVNTVDDAPDLTVFDNICDAAATPGLQCTLRAAVEQSNATAGADVINFSLPANSTINLTAGGLLINQSASIVGSGARNLTVQRSANASTGNFAVLSVVGPAYNSPAPITVSISGLTVANGLTEGNSAGGIYHFGASTLNLTEVAVKNNRANDGAGILNAGSALNVLRSTLSGNSATNSGGGIYNAYGTVNISNSTVANNTAANSGGGIFNSSDSDNNTLTLNNVTVSNNTAASGGGVTNRKTANVRNTIIAGNNAAQNPDVNGVVDFVSLGNNLIGKSDISVGFLNQVNGDKVGTTAAPLNPRLGPLQDNGGPTDTLALLIGSPAIDSGNLCVVSAECFFGNPPVPLVTDQRGGDFFRVIDVNIDIGAYELSVPAPAIVSITPTQVRAGSGGFEIVVTGSGFVNGSVVQFNGQDRPTTFVSATELRAQITAADVQAAGQNSITVFNSTPGGGTSNAASLIVFACTYTLNPASQNFPSSGGNGSVNVTTSAACAWIATTNVPWISITNASGSGNGTVNFSVGANTGVARTGTITIAGQTFTVNQASGCTYALTPTSADVASAGGNGSFSVVTGTGCTWTAASNVPWIIINNGNGTGNGTTTFTVQANVGPARSGTITVNGQVFTVNQAGGCTFTLSATSITVNAPGGGGNVNVTASAPGCAFTAVSNVPWITVTSVNSNTGIVNFTVAANTGSDRIGTLTIAGQTVTINQRAPLNFVKTPFDFDGDGRADISVFRPSSGTWHISQSSNGASNSTVFGQAGDLVAPADFDGDGRYDISVFRNGFWYRLNSSTNQFVAVQFGSAGDIPVAADYDGDEKADITVFRPSTGVWYRLNSGNNQMVAVNWGANGDIPVVGDFDGDAKADTAVFRPSIAAWYVLRSSDNSFFGISFGLPGDIPAAADFDGDRRTDISVYRPSNGTWYRINSGNNQFVPQRFGTAEDKPVAADYDGDGKADIAVFRPSNSFWYLLRSTAEFAAQQWGTAGDVPVPALNR
jgi:hypothetical protein